MEISHTYWLSKTTPKNMAFKKMEELVKTMQHPQTGVPVKSQKLFLTTIPSAFTGEDIIEWILNRLNIKETEEAVRLASIICKYGYFFHVTSNDVIPVKEDSELFRFQAPYFWVSTSWNAGNTDYAIYLVKRTLRSKEKHGLDEIENHILEELKKKLAHQWDFIRMQAEAQLRFLKDRKKTEKTIIDSQEKAFWNIMRPTIDTSPSVLDEDFKQLHPSTEIKQTKLNDLLKIKIKYFQQALKNRVRTKSSQILQSLCAYSEAYEEYDVILGNCLPSNPWISEDLTFWEVNAPIVVIPTQLRVKKWAFSFKELLNDPTGVREFMKFCENEFSGENLKFYLSCQEVKRTPTSELHERISHVFRSHLSPDCGAEVNINDSIRNRIIKRMETSISRDIFFEAEKHIFELMKKNSYPRFEQSEQYKELLANAIIPAPKKSGIFHFVKRDYFRSLDDSTDEYDSDDEEDVKMSKSGGGINLATLATSHNNNNNQQNMTTVQKANLQNTAKSITGIAIVGAVGNATSLTAAVASLSSLNLTPPTNKVKSSDSLLHVNTNDKNFNDVIFESDKSLNESRRSSNESNRKK